MESFTSPSLCPEGSDDRSERVDPRIGESAVSEVLAEPTAETIIAEYRRRLRERALDGITDPELRREIAALVDKQLDERLQRGSTSGRSA